MVQELSLFIASTSRLEKAWHLFHQHGAPWVLASGVCPCSDTAGQCEALQVMPSEKIRMPTAEVRAKHKGHFLSGGKQSKGVNRPLEGFGGQAKLDGIEL